MDIKRIREEADKMDRSNTAVSELDTQCILVEPILELIDYNTKDIDKIKRASAKKEPDILVIGEEEILVIEVKSIKSPQFNIKRGENGVAKYDDKKTGKLEKTENGLKNKDGDGVGQLRRYCYNISKNIDRYCIKNSKTKKIIPILTNGKDWVIFNYENFTDKNEIDKPLSRKMIKKYLSINDGNFIENLENIIKT